MYNQTPKRKNQSYQSAASPFTPPQYTSSLSQELKQALYERNLLTAKSRKKVCSMLDSSSPKISPRTSNDMNKRKNFRLQAVQEILTSERSYIHQLQVLMKYFVDPLKDKEILSADEFNILFGQIEMIFNLNNELLKNLENNLGNVGKAFLRLAPFFKLYSVYAFDYNRAQIVLQDLTEKNQKFRKFLEQNESRPEVQTKLMSLLIAPIQRVPRYRLLLQQVILYSSPYDDDDFKILQSRKITKEGVLHKMSSSGVTLKRYCVLMSDIFMYCKILKDRNKNTVVSNSLQCSCIFPLKKCRIVEVFPGTFKITCQGDGIILSADDATSSKIWMAAIKETIELHIQCRKTIRKGSSKRTPMRNKDLKYFEADEVLSPSRKKYDYESVYRCGDFSDSESDMEEHNSCFSFNTQNMFKRKHSNDEAIEKSCESSDAAIPSKVFKRWFRRNAQCTDVVGEYQDAEDYDPTYCFAKQLENRTYFRNNNVDSSIPMDCLAMEQYQDVLFPLRTSIGSNESTRPKTGSCTSNDQIRPPGSFISSTNTNLFLPVSSTSRKRVQFDERSNKVNIFRRNPQHYNEQHCNGQHTKGYLFTPEPANPKLTLRQRIINFFSNLF